MQNPHYEDERSGTEKSSRKQLEVGNLKAWSL
jgi:hypothetical protein